MHLKRQNSCHPGVSALDALNDYNTPSEKNVILSALYIKQITNNNTMIDFLDPKIYKS